jgi:23S rRNA pseudouridine1911/1915/1917 synthase
MPEDRTRDTRRVCTDSGTRLDVFLSRQWGPLSRRHTRAMLAAGSVRVNGRIARKGTLLRVGDVVELTMSLLDAPAPAPQPELPIAVLYEDQELIALDKPSGLPSVARRGSDRDTVANFLAAHAPETIDAGGTPLEAGLLHRLDTGTSGVLMAARSHAAWRAVREQFRRGTVEKRYTAWVEGDMRSAGTIRDAIAHDPRSPRRMIVCSQPTHAAQLAARPAITHYRPLEARADGSLIEVVIATGVRHQIRVHLAALGHPVRGDVLYGARAAPRLLLHATRLALRHPTDGRMITIESRLPDAFDR